MKYTFYFNLILTVVSAVNLFIIGKYHLTFITPLLILNLCVFFPTMVASRKILN